MSNRGFGWKRVATSAAALVGAAAAAVTAVPATAQASTATVPGTPCTASAKACVDLTIQRAWLIKDGHVIYSRAMTATGENDSTPPGDYAVTWKDIDHRSHQFHNAPMPYSVFFDHAGRAFHEGSVYTPSNGCIHLTRHSAQVFYRYLQVGDEVQIRGDSPY